MRLTKNQYALLGFLCAVGIAMCGEFGGWVLPGRPLVVGAIILLLAIAGVLS